MSATHLEFLVEEPSAEAFLTELLPKLLGDRATFTIHVHRGKSDLLRKLSGRLRGYSKWLPDSSRVVVLVDCDDDDCRHLKHRLEKVAETAGLLTRTKGGSGWRMSNRIAVEELEAWFFGEWQAVQRAYPKVPGSISSKAAYRNPDAIAGGTWEAFERVLKQAGYFSGGLRKLEAAREIGRHFDHAACCSPSFVGFRRSVVEAVS